MKHYLLMVTMFIVLMLSACGAVTPATSRRITSELETADGKGILLLIDVCLNESPIVGDDYFVISNSKDAARDVLSAVKKYISTVGVNNTASLIPFVCGASHRPSKIPERIAERIDGNIRLERKPFATDKILAADEAYLFALEYISTFLFESSLARSQSNQSSYQLEQSVNDRHIFESSISTVATRSGKSRLLYIGITGTSLSTGKAVALGIARFATGLALSVAVGPLYKSGGNNYGVVFVPGGVTDGSQTVAALLDLKTGGIVKTNIIHSYGDPMKAETLSQGESMRLLLRDIAFSETAK